MTNAHQRHAQITEWTALSQTGGHSATLIENGSNIYFYLFSILNYKTEQKRKPNGQLIFFNPVAFRTAKTLWSFGRSECSRVKAYLNHLPPFWWGFTLKEKNLLPLEQILYFQRRPHFWRAVVQRNKQKVTKVVPFVRMVGKHGSELVYLWLKYSAAYPKLSRNLIPLFKVEVNIFLELLVKCLEVNEWIRL